MKLARIKLKALLILAILLIVFSFSYAQQPAKPLTPEEEAESAQKALIEKANKVDAALTEYNTARALRDASLYKLLSERGIKASECAGPGQDGKPIPFTCVMFDASGKVSVIKPKAETVKK